jgi:hypothetical protein
MLLMNAADAVGGSRLMTAANAWLLLREEALGWS